MHFNAFVHGPEVEGGRKLREITVDCLSFLTEVEDRAPECGESLAESLILKAELHSVVLLCLTQRGRNSDSEPSSDLLEVAQVAKVAVCTISRVSRFVRNWHLVVLRDVYV